MNLPMETGSKEGETLVGAVKGKSKYKLLQLFFWFFFSSDQLELAIQRGRYTGEEMFSFRDFSISSETLRPF